MIKILIAALSAGLLLTTNVKADNQFVIIGSAGQQGVYYAVGQSICKLINGASKKVRCTAPSTAGSVDNVDAIKNGSRDMGIVQADIQYNAYNGLAQFDGSANPELRSILSMYGESLTIVARADSAIVQLADLKGKRVNIGNPGSGQRATMDVLMSALDWKSEDFAALSELNSTEQATALCDNTVDAIVFVAGHPNESIEKATSLCDSVLVSVTGEAVDQLVSGHSFYSKATIAGGLYKGNPTPVETLSVGSTLVSSVNVSEQTIYEITKIIFNNIEVFRELHPALKSLDEQQMTTANLFAPLHSGAAKYYQEQGYGQ